MRHVTLGLMFGMIALLTDRAGAEDKFTSDVAKQAVTEYLAEIDDIERVAARRKVLAKERLARVLQETELLQTHSQARYRGMLGSYFNQEGRIPFILLSVPNGQNLFGEYAQSVFNGKYDHTQPLASFHARGHVVIAKEGRYLLEASRGYGDFKLNGLGYNLGEPAPSNRRCARVTLKPGAYSVEFSTINNGGQLPEASIRIVDEETHEELPIFVYESELKSFQSDLALGVELTETSKWTLEENRLK